MARPKEYTKERIEEILISLNTYIAETEIPIVAEFAYKYNIRRGTLYDFPELLDAIKGLIDKKEAQLERKALNREIDHTMAIFSLKQLGWRDKKEIEHSGEIKTINIDEKINELEQNLDDNTDD